MFTTRAETQNGHDTVGTSRGSFSTRLSLAFIVSSLFTASVISFSLGRSVRNNTYQPQVLSSPPILQPPHTLSLPTPVLPEGKKKPNADYSSKYFHTPGVTSRKSDVLLDDRFRPRSRHSPGGSGFEVLPAGSVKHDTNYTFDNEEDEDEVIHQPKGQHLLVDIKNVDASFLNSEEQLATAMISLISQSELTLLSYHCHGLEPMGVTCVGVLLESHVSFHTWPIPGVITLDLFTCGPKSLTPLVSVIEKLFAIPQKAPSTNKGGETLLPRVIWAHKKRGFDFSDDDWNREDVEHERYLLGWREYEMKTQVAHEQTLFQEFEVHDVIDSRMNKIEEYERSLSKDGSYESQHPEFFKPDRVVYLDKIMQSRLSGVEAYHEALVHPAMLAHADPRRVAIIGGGEGATLREVLKHKTVQKCVMVEIDVEMVAASKKHLPQWNNCSDLTGSVGSCFDDPRAEVYFEDAVGWFINRYSDNDKIDAMDKFDVIIMDALYVYIHYGLSLGLSLSRHQLTRYYCFSRTVTPTLKLAFQMSCMEICNSSRQ
jgi:S-adenosylmethionine decarboxylase proenzyme